MERIPRKFGVLALAILPLLAGCAADDDEPLAPEIPAAGELFARYVAVGNSITAGFQSAGINDSTQQRSYAVLLARQAGDANFSYPSLAFPGCPPPLAVPLSPQRVGNGTAQTCALRSGGLPVQRPLQNLAVPGAQLASTLDSQVAANVLTTLVLGGRTQAQALADAQPSFVSVWIGNNDALSAALAGQLALLTPAEAFSGRYDQLVAAINGSPAEGAVLIGVVDPSAAPALQPGAFFFAAASLTGGRFGGAQGKPVNPNCSPITATGEPNPLARNFVSIQILTDANFAEINCSNEAYPMGDPRRGTYVLTPEEAAAISERVRAFNQVIQARAQANEWLYVDPNQILLSASNGLTDVSRIRKCQGLATARTPQEIAVAVQNTCPSPNPQIGFGSLISYDGVHPSTEAHQLVANALAQAINTRYGTNIGTG